MLKLHGEMAIVGLPAKKIILALMQMALFGTLDAKFIAHLLAGSKKRKKCLIIL